MLKCITFDGDVTTLNDLMEYLEQINRILAEVSAQLSNKQVAQPVFSVRELGLCVLIRKIFYIWKDTAEIILRYIGQKESLYFRK